ncbi:MAG: hypothetical protein ACTSSI_17320 [Candidatus Helarchaeota archaeon]
MSKEPQRSVKSEILRLFSQMGYVLGIPDMILKVFAIVWMSDKPVSLQDIEDFLKAEKSSIAKTTISVSLKELLNLGAIEKVRLENERANFYTTNMKFLELFQLSLSKILSPAQIRTNKFDQKFGNDPLGRRFYDEAMRLHKFLDFMVNYDFEE